jgi:hypothetical protein
MWKAVLAGTTALAIACSSLVYAQQRPGRGSDGFRGRQFNSEDVRAFAEARLAALKAGLALSAEQEKNWPAFEQAARDYAKLRLDRMTARREARRNGEQRTRDPIERMRRRGDAMSQTGAALSKLAEATDPLYKSLDDGQKRRFAILSRLGGGRDGGRGRGFRGRQDGPRGFDRDRRRTELAPHPFERGARPDTRGQYEGEERL